MAVEDVTKRKQPPTTAPSCTQQSEVSCESSNVMFVPERYLAAGLLLFRIVNTFLTQTFFVPDEFWQGPEVAHRIVFGYGYLTWEWKEGLRGWSFPLIFAASYKLLALFGVDTAKFLVVVPRLVQACIASCGDLFLYKLAVKRFGPQSGMWTLICYLISWFTLYCVTRTLTNSLETVLYHIFTFCCTYNPKHDRKEKSCTASNSCCPIQSLRKLSQGFVWRNGRYL